MLQRPPEFSLVLGGPLFQLLRRAHLAEDALLLVRQRGGAPADEPFVGTGDIQSLADLANAYEVVQSMRIAPITKDAILRLAAAALAPLVPLLLTMMPLEELVRTLFGILF
jgi:hypothetical protein